MKMEKCVKDSFSVIGKEGSAELGEGFVEKLRAEVNAIFSEAAHLAKREDD